MPWQVEIVPEVQAWLATLDRAAYDRVMAVASILGDEGPARWAGRSWTR
jgi:hypothetical protein